MHHLFTLVCLGRFKLIQHHFPVRGDSSLLNDRDYGLTETKKNHERIYTPEQDMAVDYDKLAPFFKKSVRSGKQTLSMQKGRVFKYADAHASEV